MIRLDRLETIVPVKWVQEVQHRSRCYGIMWSFIKEIIKELPEPRRTYWTSRLGGVDTAARGLYDANKVNKTHNETTETETPKPSVPLGTHKEAPMRGDEEE